MILIFAAVTFYFPFFRYLHCSLFKGKKIPDGSFAVGKTQSFSLKFKLKSR